MKLHLRNITWHTPSEARFFQKDIQTPKLLCEALERTKITSKNHDPEYIEVGSFFSNGNIPEKIEIISREMESHNIGQEVNVWIPYCDQSTALAISKFPQ